MMAFRLWRDAMVEWMRVRFSIETNSQSREYVGSIPLTTTVAFWPSAANLLSIALRHIWTVAVILKSGNPRQNTNVIIVKYYYYKLKI